MKWMVEFVDDGVEAALSAMPADIRAAFRPIVELIGSYGLERMREPYEAFGRAGLGNAHEGQGRHCACRLRHRRRPPRCRCDVFPKKSHKTPRREIETALRRAKEVQ